MTHRHWDTCQQLCAPTVPGTKTVPHPRDARNTNSGGTDDHSGGHLPFPSNFSIITNISAAHNSSSHQQITSYQLLYGYSNKQTAKRYSVPSLSYDGYPVYDFHKSASVFWGIFSTFVTNWVIGTSYLVQKKICADYLQRFLFRLSKTLNNCRKVSQSNRNSHCVCASKFIMYLGEKRAPSPHGAVDM